MYILYVFCMFLHVPIVNQVDLFFFYQTWKTNKNAFENIFLQVHMFGILENLGFSFR